jgi:hypothetical protein
MRVLEEFFKAIAKLIRTNDSDPDTSRVQERFDEVYRQFFRTPAQHFYESDKESILDELIDNSKSEQEVNGKVEMLSELMYRDALLKNYMPEKCMILEKSLYLLDYLERKSRTYSWDRELKMEDIKKQLNEFY